MTCSFPTRILSLCTALFAILLGQLHAQAIVRIMPLGDSITYGMGAGAAMIPGGYRDPLAHLYAANNANFLFVGSDGTNSTAYLVANGQQFNEGHTGWRIDQIQGSINGWQTSAAPNMVLLHIGTNDILQYYNVGTGGYDTSTAIQRLTALISSMYAVNPSLKVVLSTLIPIQDDRDNYVKNYNAALAATVVPGFVSQGKDIVLVDNYANFVDGTGAWKTALYADYAHPNADGYAAMAATWATAALPVVQGVTFDSKSAALASGEDSTLANNLLRAGSSTLASATVPPVGTGSAFPITGVNDGSVTANANYTYYPVTTTTAGVTVMPAIITFELNTATNTGGYDISSVQAITGWGDHNLGAQRFQLLLSINHDDYVSYGTFTNAATVNGGNSSFLSTVSHTSGILATHVTGIRYIFMNPDTSNGATAVGSSQAGGGSTGGTVIRELQAFGTPSTPVAPPPCTITATVTAGANSQDGAIANNLLRQGQPTLSSVTAPPVSLPANFTTAGLNDGSAAANTNITYYSVVDGASGATVFPDTVTFQLNTATNPNGYDISSLQVISGWGDHNLGEARFQLLLSINGGDFTDYGTYRNNSTLSTANGGYLSTLNPTTGSVIASHVTGIRFIFLNPDRSNGDTAVGVSQAGSSGGTVIREIQAFGTPSAASGLSFSDWATNTWHLSGNDALPTADPNANGIPNLLEYALGGDPAGSTTGTAILPMVTLTAGVSNYSFTHDADRSGANLSVQVSDDLVNWTEIAHSTAGATFTSGTPGVTVNETGSGNAKAVTIHGLPASATVPAPASRFLRLQATSN